MEPPSSPGQDGCEIDTEKALRTLLDFVLAGGDSRSPSVGTWIDFFVRKFEPSKRLRRRYAPDLRIVDHAMANKSAYVHLSFVLSEHITDSKQLRFLNALLKLNDLILSTPYGVTDAALVRSAVTREIALVEELATLLCVSFAEQSEC